MTLSTAAEREAYAEHLRILSSSLGLECARAESHGLTGLAGELGRAQSSAESWARALVRGAQLDTPADQLREVPMRGP